MLGVELLHLVVVEEALGGILLIKALVLNSLTLEVLACLFSNIALILVANVVFVAQFNTRI